MSASSSILRSTVTRELTLGLAGIALVLFVIVHLSGNLLIYAGPDTFNSYSQHLHDMGVLLWVARIGLITVFGLHIVITVYSWWTNRSARERRYAVTVYRSRRGIGTRTMIITGTLIVVFVGIHLLDFTFVDKAGANSIVAGMNNGESLGLYGVVWNGFSNPIRAVAYVIFMCCLGLHLSHAVSSVLVTLGSESDPFVRRAEWAAKAFAVLMTLGFSSIPVYIFVRAHWIG